MSAAGPQNSIVLWVAVLLAAWCTFAMGGVVFGVSALFPALYAQNYKSSACSARCSASAATSAAAVGSWPATTKRRLAEAGEFLSGSRGTLLEVAASAVLRGRSLHEGSFFDRLSGKAEHSKAEHSPGESKPESRNRHDAPHRRELPPPQPHAHSCSDPCPLGVETKCCDHQFVAFSLAASLAFFLVDAAAAPWGELADRRGGKLTLAWASLLSIAGFAALAGGAYLLDDAIVTAGLLALGCAGPGVFNGAALLPPPPQPPAERPRPSVGRRLLRHARADRHRRAEDPCGAHLAQRGRLRRLRPRLHAAPRRGEGGACRARRTVPRLGRAVRAAVCGSVAAAAGARPAAPAEVEDTSATRPGMSRRRTARCSLSRRPPRRSRSGCCRWRNREARPSSCSRCLDPCVCLQAAVEGESKSEVGEDAGDESETKSDVALPLSARWKREEEAARLRKLAVEVGLYGGA